MTKKEKKKIQNEAEVESPANEDSLDTEVDNNENLATPSYEELFDKNEDLEKALLRANADLDNALKRTLSEVEKAHTRAFASYRQS